MSVPESERERAAEKGLRILLGLAAQAADDPAASVDDVHRAIQAQALLAQLQISEYIRQHPEILDQ